MDFAIAALLAWLLPVVIGFFVIYYAIRLAIRHERDWERRNRRPD